MSLGTRIASSQLLRVVAAVIVIIAAGFWSFIITFSDYPATWSRTVWFAYLLAWHLPSAFLVGFLVPARWYFAVATAWGALGLYATPSILLPLLGTVLGVGYLGGRVARRRHG